MPIPHNVQGDEIMVLPPPLAELFGIPWLYWYQPLLLIALIALIVFWKMYRNKQM
jgi:hypothetical protein